jgi:hypothetical protein
MTQAAAPHVAVENPGHRGLTAAFWGCLLAVLGILFSFSVVFIPVAVVCTLVGLVKGVSARDAISIGTSLLAACLCVVGFATSPVLLAIAVLLTTNVLPRSTAPVPHSQQQSQQTGAILPPSPLPR